MDDLEIAYIKIPYGVRLKSSYKYLAEMGDKLRGGTWEISLGKALKCIVSGVCAEAEEIDHDKLVTQMIRCVARRDKTCRSLVEHVELIVRNIHKGTIRVGEYQTADVVDRLSDDKLAAIVAKAVKEVLKANIYLLDKFVEKRPLTKSKGIKSNEYKYFFILTSPVFNKYNVYEFAMKLLAEAFGSLANSDKLALRYYISTKEGLKPGSLRVLTTVAYTSHTIGLEWWGIAGFHGLVKPIVEALKSMGFMVSFPRNGGWRPGPSRTLKLKTDVLNQLRPYQRAALKAWLDAGGLGTIVLPTGGGKTHVALAAIAKLRVPTAIFVTTVELAEQWRKKIKEVLGYDAGLLGAGEKKIKDITVVIYNSGAKYIDDIYDRFVMHIYDEGHHLPADSFKVIGLRSRTWYRMVLSATPKRADSNEGLIFAIGGPIVYRMSHATLAKQGYLVPVEYRVVTVQLLPEEEEKYYNSKGARALKIAAASNAKLPVLVEIVKSELKSNPKTKIIVFTQYVDQAEKAMEALREAIGADKVVLLTGKLDKKSREANMNAFKSGKARVLIATTVADEGVDIPDADVAVILSGYSQERQFIQRIGRVVRMAAGKKKAKIYEIVTRDTVDYDLHLRRMQALTESVATVKSLKAEEEAMKRRAQSRGRVAEVLAVELGDGYALLLKKSVKDLTKTELKALIKASRTRPSRSWKLDEARKGKVPRRVETWIKAPDKYDIPGVDTPDAPHVRARRKISESVSRTVRKAMKREPEKCTVKETRDGYYAVVCYHKADNGKTIPVMHGKFTTRQAAQRKARLVAAGKSA